VKAHRLVFVIAALALTARLRGDQETNGQVPRFASTIDIVSVNVAVTDQSRSCFSRYPPYWNSGWDGCPVAGLTAEAFELYEDGVRQQIGIFQSGETPIAVSLVLDTSPTNRGTTSEVLDAAVGIVRKLRRADVAQVVGSAGSRATYQPFTSDRSVLEKAIRAARGGSYGKTVDLLLRTLESAAQPFDSLGIRRHAVVYLTDGTGTGGGPRATSLNAARRSPAVVYTIAMSDETLDASSESAASLRHLAAITGGRAFFPHDVRSLPSLYTQIYDEVSQQYTIGYTSTNTRVNGDWRTIEVRINRAATGIRSRQGYFAPTDR
jgi:VWFA-related protein